MFSPLLVAAVGAIVKRILTLGAGWLVSRQVWTSADANAYVEALAFVLTTAALTVSYDLYDRYLKPYIFRLLGPKPDAQHP